MVSIRGNYRKVFFGEIHQRDLFSYILTFKNGSTSQSQDRGRGTVLYRSLNLVIDILHASYV